MVFKKSLLWAVFLLCSSQGQTVQNDQSGCENLSLSFCHRIVDKGEKCKLFRREDFGPESRSFIYGEAAGRLGNHLLGYAAFLELTRNHSYQAYIDINCKSVLSETFVPEFVELPVLTDVFCNPEEIPFESYNGPFADLINDPNLRKGRFLLFYPDVGEGLKGGYKPEDHQGPEQEAFQRSYSSYLRRHVRFSEEIQSRVNQVLIKVAEQMKLKAKDVTFVGIHNRRTDHLEYSKVQNSQVPLKKSYFYQAMDYFRDDLENVAFLYVSDDMTWGKKNLKNLHKDLFFVGDGEDLSCSPDMVQKSVSFDLALLTSCNHTIVTRGTFSLWAAMLSGGDYYTEYGPILADQVYT